jgi:YopX protein
MKFKIWDGLEGKMIQPNEQIYSLNQDGNLTPGDRYTKLLEFTGFLDKNGVEIYEGDEMTEEGQVEKLEVQKSLGTFVLVYPSGFDYFHDIDFGSFQVVGNIYE